MRNHVDFLEGLKIILEKEGYTYKKDNSILVKNLNIWKRVDSELIITTDNQEQYIELIEGHCHCKLKDNDLFLTILHFLDYFLEPDNVDGKINKGKGSWFFMSLRNNETLLKPNKTKKVVGSYYEELKIYYFDSLLNTIINKTDSFLNLQDYSYYYDTPNDISLAGLVAKVNLSGPSRAVGRLLISYDLFTIIFRTNFLNDLKDGSHKIICSFPSGSNNESYIATLIDNYADDNHMLFLISVKDLLSFKMFKLDFTEGTIPVDLDYDWSNKETTEEKNKEGINDLFKKYEN